MKRIFTIIAAVYAVSATVSAQDEAFGWMSAEKNPVYSSMAGASMVSENEIAWSAFNNPAAMPFSEDKFGAGVSWLSSPDAIYGGSCNLGAGMRFGKRVGVAVGGNYNIGSEYDVIDDAGNPQGTFKTSAMMFSAGVGVKIIDMLSVGVNLKYGVERLYEGGNPGAFATDIYAMFNLKGFGVSAGVSNVGGKVKSDSGESFSIPSSVRIGAGYHTVLAKKHYVEADVDANYYFSGNFAAAAGAQYGYNDLLFVRAGYRYGGGSVIPSYASVGVGVKYFGVRLNAGYIVASGSGSPLKNTFSVGLGFGF